MFLIIIIGLPACSIGCHQRVRQQVMETIVHDMRIRQCYSANAMGMNQCEKMRTHEGWTKQECEPER